MGKERLEFFDFDADLRLSNRTKAECYCKSQTACVMIIYKWELRMKTNAAFITNILITTTLLSGTILASTLVSADNDSVVDEINLTVPVSCTMSGTGMNTHNANIDNGLYVPDIGTTTLHAFCNDNEGFAIYAAGYTGNEVGGTNSNKLVGTTASSNATIESGIATGPVGSNDISNWAMKLAVSQDSGDTTGTNAFTIDSAPNVALPSQAESGATQAPFSNYHVVPNEYVKVAHKNSGTDMTATTGGVKLTTTYAAYISKTQPADTYSGQVIYTLVHPSNQDAPIANPATLDTGKIVNSKLKSLAATVVNGEETTITPVFDPNDDYDSDYAYDEFIKTISVHLKTSVPVGFVPTEANTISSSMSKKPIYIVFDNTNDAGIMHFYTEGEQIILPSDSSYMFYYLNELADLSALSGWNSSNVILMDYLFYNAGVSASAFSLDLSSWDISNVTSLEGMFEGAGSSADTWYIGDLSSWDTSNVKDLSYMFYHAAYAADTWSVGDISSWNTANVEDMSCMFYSVAHSTSSFSLDLSDWNTSNVTNMRSMFAYAGFSVVDTFSLNLSNWDTSSVEDMGSIFTHAGRSATSFILDISSWSTFNVTNMNNMFNNAGYSSSSWSVTIPQTNGNNINNTTSHMYGQTTSISGTPPSGKSFTLVQP